ncbi:hypothetical protein, partial [Mesorhizobium sp.]
AILRAEPASSVEPALHVESGFSARPGARSPAEAAAAAAMAALGSDATTRKDQPAGRKSMFGGLARAFKSKKAADVPPLAGPAPDADIPSVD